MQGSHPCLRFATYSFALGANPEKTLFLSPQAFIPRLMQDRASTASVSRCAAFNHLVSPSSLHLMRCHPT